MEMRWGIDLDWSASGNAGTIVTSMEEVTCARLDSAAIGGNGPSREALLIAAIGSCYSIILSMSGHADSRQP